MTDKLNMDLINSLPQPFVVKFCGDKYGWPLYDLCVETGLIRIDVCGKLECASFSEVVSITDADGQNHNPDDWWIE